MPDFAAGAAGIAGGGKVPIGGTGIPGAAGVGGGGRLLVCGIGGTDAA